MKLIESIKLRHRANKYKNKDDKGGIAYVISALKPGQTAFDIGAHKAGYLYFMRQLVGKNGHVFAFEPQSILYRYIKKIKELFHWDNVTIEHLALSDSSATVKLYIPNNKVSKATSPGATIVEHNEDPNIVATENVSTETLDTYCKQHNIKPAFLKMDVEGNELKVLKGGMETLKKYKPKILVEIEARHVGNEKVLETFSFLQALGYQGYILHNLEHLPLADFSFDKYQNLNDMSNYCNNFIFE